MPLVAGTYTRVHNWVADDNADIAIEADRHDEEDDSIAAALNSAIYRDGQVAFSGDQSMGGNQLTNVGDAGAAGDAVSRSYGDARYIAPSVTGISTTFAPYIGAGAPINCSIAVVVTGNTLVFGLKDASGGTPSATSPILFPFRSATAVDGTLTWLAVTAASNIVINETATLGTSNGVPFSVWCVVFNDGGTIRPALINCLSIAGTPGNYINIFPLQSNTVASATQEGDASDSAHVFYSHGASVTSKPYIILGRAIWNSGLAAAGVWSAAPSVVVNHAPGMRLPGAVMQRVVGGSESSAAGTTVMPADDTIPQNTEGDQYMTQAITPVSAANMLKITATASLSSTNTADALVVGALFQDSTASAISTRAGARDVTANTVALCCIEHDMLAATTSATTFNFRAGTPSAGTTRINGASGSRAFGGTARSFITIEEIVG